VRVVVVAGWGGADCEAHLSRGRGRRVVWGRWCREVEGEGGGEGGWLEMRDGWWQVRGERWGLRGGRWEVSGERWEVSGGCWWKVEMVGGDGGGRLWSR